MPPEMNDNDIPSLDDFPEHAELTAEIANRSNAQGDDSLTAVLGGQADLLAALGRRAIDVFTLGLESVAGQKPAVRVSAASMADITALTEAFATPDHVALEVRFALNETEAQPVTVLVPTDDLGRILHIGMAAEELADETFARGQAELIANSTRELLDLAGLMLFIDELAGGEATLGTVRLSAIGDSFATLREAAPDAARFDLQLALPDGSAARVSVLVPSSLIERLATLLSEPPIAQEPPAAARQEPSLRAVGDGQSEATNISPLRGGARVPEPDAPVHPVRFPALNASEVTTAAQQQVDLILDVPLRVSVELGRTSMTVDEVLALGPGSVIELNKLAGEPVDVLVNDRLIARGEVVVVDENFGVRVTEVISPRSRATAVAR